LEAIYLVVVQYMTRRAMRAIMIRPSIFFQWSTERKWD